MASFLDTIQQMQEAKDKAAMSGQPIRPDFASINDANGNLQSKYQVSAGPNITADQRGLNEIRNRALSKGPSTWANMMLAQQDREAAMGRDQANQDAMSGNAQAVSQLAQRGGVSSGAAERLANNAQKNIAMSRLAANNQAMKNRMQIGLQDEGQKAELLRGLPGMELQALEPAFKNRDTNLNVQQFNVGNAMKGVGAQNDANMQAYHEKMASWAANKQADATEASGKK